jgi:hypothetical protein
MEKREADGLAFESEQVGEGNHRAVESLHDEAAR